MNGKQMSEEEEALNRARRRISRRRQQQQEDQAAMPSGETADSSPLNSAISSPVKSPSQEDRRPSATQGSDSPEKISFGASRKSLPPLSSLSGVSQLLMQRRTSANQPAAGTTPASMNRRTLNIPANQLTSTMARGGLGSLSKLTSDDPSLSLARKRINSSIKGNIDQLGVDDGFDQIETIEKLTSELEKEFNIDYDYAKPEFKEAEFREAQVKLFFSPDDPVPGRKDNAQEYNDRMRMLKQEGFYVDEKSGSEFKKWTILENRLMRTDPEKWKSWFGPDGRMQTNCDDIIKNPVRPAKVSELDSNLLDFDSNQSEMAMVLHKPSKSTEDASSLYGSNSYQLVFTFHSLNFAEHPLMTEEIRIAKSIQEMVQKVQQRQIAKHLQYLEGKVLAVQEAYYAFKEKFPNTNEYMKRGKKAIEPLIMPNAVGPSPADSNSFEYYTELKRLLNKVRDAKQEYETESRNDRALEWKLLKLWDSLKQIRNTQKFTSSSLRLVIQQISSQSQTEYHDKIKTYIQKEFEERKEMVEIESKLYGKVSDEVADESADENSKRRRRRKSKRESFTAEMAAFLNQNEDEIADAGDKMVEQVSKSDRITIVEEKILEDIKETISNCFRPVGMPVLVFKITFDTPITDVYDCPNIEQLRRGHVASLKMRLKLLVDSKEVYQSQPISLKSNEFTLPFSEEIDHNIVLRIREVPHNIMAQIHQHGAFGDSLLGECNLDTPGVGKVNLTLNQEIQISKFEGTSFTLSTAYDAYVRNTEEGNHIRNKSGTFQRTTGWLFATVVWDTDSDGNPLAPSSINSNVKAATLKNLEIQDPNDPRANMQKTLQPVAGSGKGDSDDLALAVDNGSFSRRHEIFKMRNQNQIVVKSAIPMDEKEVQPGLFEVKGNRLDDTITSLKKLGADNMISLSAEQLSNIPLSEFMKRIRSHELYRILQSQSLQKPLTVADFVKEEHIVDDGQESFLQELLKQRRPLKPARKPRRVQTNVLPTQCRIVAQVIGAINIPVRTQSGFSDRDPKNRHASVQALVEMHFQHAKQSTTIVESSHPQWNETLSLPLNPPGNDFRPEILQNIRDDIYINIFDEYVVDLIQDDRDRNRNIHQRRERNWLGTLTVPFSTVYQHISIDGYFHVQTPAILMNYEKDNYDSDILGVNTDQTMLNLFLTLDPPLPQPDPLIPRFDTDEDPYVLRLASRWKTEVEPKVKVNPTAINLSGKTVLLPRYIRPLPTPPNIETLDRILRFVSLIPFFEDRSALSASLDLLSDSQQFLDIGAGDELEHAVLLCNFMKYMKKRAYIAVGIGLPEGKSAYVLVDESNNRGSGRERSFNLYNPLSGHTYSPQDPHIPLKEIHFVFDHVNIWANVQLEKQPSTMNFDFADLQLWNPLFKRDTVASLPTIQPESLKFANYKVSAVRELERELLTTLTNRIEKWRGRFVTKWNRAIGRTFETILPNLESRLAGDRLLPNDLVTGELKKLQSLYQIRGFPLNMSFTDIEAVVEAVFNTDIHSNIDPKTEFALAVYCHPYIEGVISVWVYVASLTKIRL